MSWKEVEILTRMKKKGKGNHINLETARLKDCGNSMALLIEWLEAIQLTIQLTEPLNYNSLLDERFPNLYDFLSLFFHSG